jgi:hypothetical protein
MNRWTSILLLVVATAFICGADTWEAADVIVPPPMELVELSSALHDEFYLNTAWDANTEPDLAGYRIYKSRTSGDYTGVTPIDVAKETMGRSEECLFLGDYDPFKVECCEYKVEGFTEGTWYLVATAYDDSDPPNESAYSEELTHTFIIHVPKITKPEDMREVKEE